METDQAEQLSVIFSQPVEALNKNCSRENNYLFKNQDTLESSKSTNLE